MDNRAQTLKNFEEHLTVSNHNMAARTISSSGPQGFLCEICTENSSYFMKILIDPEIEFAIIEAYLGIKVQPSLFTIAAQYVLQINDEKKVGSLHISDHGDIYCHVEASFVSTPLTGKDLEKMTQIAISFLEEHRHGLEHICQGIPPANRRTSCDH